MNPLNSSVDDSCLDSKTVNVESTRPRLLNLLRVHSIMDILQKKVAFRGC